MYWSTKGPYTWCLIATQVWLRPQHNVLVNTVEHVSMQQPTQLLCGPQRWVHLRVARQNGLLHGWPSSWQLLTASLTMHKQFIVLLPCSQQYLWTSGSVCASSLLCCRQQYLWTSGSVCAFSLLCCRQQYLWKSG